jgi:hypothetical protein
MKQHRFTIDPQQLRETYLALVVFSAKQPAHHRRDDRDFAQGC